MYYPKCINIPLNAVVFALSESGEREELIELISAFQQKNNRIVSITNEADCTLAKMSDWNISYDLNHVYVNGGYFWTNYKDYTKASDNYNGTGMAGVDVYSRSNKVFGLGVDIHF